MKLVSEAKSRIKELTIDEVVEKIKRNDSFYFIDVREDREVQRGCIKGAAQEGLADVISMC